MNDFFHIQKKNHVKVPIVDTLPTISYLEELYQTIIHFEYPVWVIFEYGNSVINLEYRNGELNNPRQFIETLNCSNIPESISYTENIYIQGIKEKDTFYTIKYHIQGKGNTTSPKEDDWLFLAKLGFTLIPIRTCYSIEKTIDYIKEVNRSVILIDNRYNHYRPITEMDKSYFVYVPKEAIHSTVLPA